MTAVSVSPPRPHWVHELPDRPVAMACAGHLAVVAGGDGEVAAIDLTSGTLAATTRCEGGLLSLAVSPAGRIALTGPFGAWLWRPSDGSRQVLDDHQWCACAAWREDDAVAVTTGRTVTVFDCGGTAVWRTPEHASTATAVAWTGRGRQLTSASYGGVRLQDARAKAPSRELAHTGSLVALAARPAGRWVVAGSQDATLQVFDTRNDERLEMSGYPWRATRLAFDATGRYLANDGAPEVTVWDFSGPGPGGRAPVLLAAGGERGDRPTAFAWHPRLPILLVGWESGGCHAFDVTRGVPGRPMSATRSVCGGDVPVAAVAWDADGERTVVATTDGRVLCLAVGSDRAA